MRPEFYDALAERIFLFIGEISVLFSFSLFSVLLFVFRRQAYKIVDLIGVSYLRDQKERIESINSELLEIKGAFCSNGYALYRTRNGKHYIPNDAKHSEIKIKLVNEKPKEFFPYELDYETYKELINISFGNDHQFITYNKLRKASKTSLVLSFMESRQIKSIFSYKLKDDTNTYGIVLFTWNYEIDNFNQVFTDRIAKKLDYINIEFKIFIKSPFRNFL